MTRNRRLTATRPHPPGAALLAAGAVGLLLTVSACGKAETTTTPASPVGTASSPSTPSGTGSGSDTGSGTDTATGTGTATGDGPTDSSGIPDTFNAFGTEPFWQVAVTPSGLTYTRVGEPDRALTATRSPSGDGVAYTGRGFTLTVTPGDCSDGMSDAVYPWTATFVYDGETLAGCANRR